MIKILYYFALVLSTSFYIINYKAKTSNCAETSRNLFGPTIKRGESVHVIPTEFNSVEICQAQRDKCTDHRANDAPFAQYE